MKCAIYQFNPTIGAITENTNRLIAAIHEAIDNGCDIFISSELAICGYIPKDLLLRPDFQKQINNQLQRFLTIKNITLLIGTPYIENNHCYNSVFVIKDGQIIGRYDKQKLPNYEVFDEYRYFTAGTQPLVFEHNDIKLGVIICEDTWHKEPAQMAKIAGAELLITINASPFSIGKLDERIAVVKERVHETNLPIIYVNQLGGQDNIIFDGASFIINEHGTVIAQFPAFRQELNYCTINCTKPFTCANKLANQDTTYPNVVESVYLALRLSLYDYVTKNGFKGVILGLSGGIDSALTLAIAVDALGANRVTAVMMPSVYTADISIIDSRDMVKRLNVAYEEIEINPIFNQFRAQLAPVFNKLPINTNTADVTDENLQARTRGVLLMALSNKLGYLVLTTGNKSEMAAGYATLYGDMAGGFALLKDVPKTLVYQLSLWRNEQDEIIPPRIITRAPSAELRENQTDQDSLPEYAVLDAIIDLIVERGLSSADIIAKGYNEADVTRVARLIKLNEYKRSQAAIGPKITKCAFNNDWRYPITNHFQF